MKKYKKTISPVVATALLLVVAVVAVIGFQGWYTTYQSGILADVEQTSSIGTLINIEGIIGNKLYIKSGSNDILKIFKIRNANGNVMCEFQDGIGSNLLSDTRLLFDFDDNLATDLSGYNNNGTLLNGASCSVDGIDGYGCSFDGANDYIALNSLDVTNNREVLSVSAWINLDTISSFNSIYAASINNGGSPSDVSRIHFSVNSAGRVYLSARSTDAEAASDFAGTRTLLTGQWYHVVGILDFKNNLVKMYVNGEEDTVTRTGVMSFGSTSTPSSDSASSSMGLEDDGSASNQFDGIIDEIAVYSKKLSQDEIDLLYDSQKAKLYEQLLTEGIKEIDVTNCNLVKDQVYNVVGFTNTNKFDQKIIAK